MSPEEGALLTQYASERDAEAFRTLVERHQRMVYGACFRVLGNAADAEDAAQDVFLQLARHAGRLRAPIAAWLHKVAVRAALKTARKERRHQEKAGHAMARSTKRTEPTWDDVKEYVDETIAALPKDLRQAIVLHFLEGRSQQIIADETRSSQSTVSRRIRSGVDALRSHLAKKGVVMSVAALVGILGANAADAAVPVTLTAALGKMALAGPTTLKGAAIMKIGAITLVAAAAVTVGIVTLKSDAQQAPLTPPPPAPVVETASKPVAPRFDRAVPEWTPEGQAKGMGNALITLSGLVQKLDGAVVEDDEIRVPGWTTDDDYALATALFDYFGAQLYAESSRMFWPTDHVPVEVLEDLVRNGDRERQIGGAVLVPIWLHRQTETQAELERLSAIAMEMTSAADAAIRAAGIYLIGDSRFRGTVLGETRHDILAKAMTDPSVEVRFAAAQAAGNDVIVARDPGAYPDYLGLLEDESASVRVMVCFSLMELAHRSGQMDRRGELVMRAIQDPNPLAAIVAMISVPTEFYSREEFPRMLNYLSESENPWWGMAAKPFLPILQEKGNLQMPLLLEMAQSDKPSHQLLAALGFAIPFFISAEDQVKPPDSELQALTTFSNMDVGKSLPLQLAQILNIRMVGGPAAEEQLQKALQSSDEIERSAALAASFWMPLEPASPEFKQALIAAYRSPFFSESIMAARALPCNLSPSECGTLLREEVARGTEFPRLAVLTMGLFELPHSTRKNREKRIAYYDAIRNAVLDSGNIDLQRYLWMYKWGEMAAPGDSKRDEKQAEYVRKIQIEVLLQLLAADNTRTSLSQKKPLISAVLNRLKELYIQGTEEARSKTRQGLADLLKDKEAWPRVHYDATAGDTMWALFTQVVGDGFNGNTEPDATAFKVLNGMFCINNPGLPPFRWTETPAEVRDGLRCALSYATHPTHGRVVAEILASMYIWNGNGNINQGDEISSDSPDIWQAMETARAKIMEEGSDEEKSLLLMGLAQSPVQSIYNRWYSELERAIMTGTVPPELRDRAVYALHEHCDLLTTEFVHFALKLSTSPDRDENISSRMLWLLTLILERRLYHNMDKPEWASQAAEDVWGIVSDNELFWGYKQNALRLYIFSAGEAGEDNLRKLILDQDQAMEIRTRAANTFVVAAPKTTFYEEMLPKLAELPEKLRLGLAESAARSPDAPKSVDFFITVLTDKSIRVSDRQRLLWDTNDSRGAFANTLEMREALTKLRDDSKIGREVGWWFDRSNMRN